MQLNMSAWRPIRGWLADSLPWVMLSFGFICFGAGHIIGSETAPRLFSFLTGVGNALLAGGAFGAFVKSVQFAELFQKALHKVVWADEFVGNRKDLEDVWIKVSDQLNGRKFPHLKYDISRQIVEHYYKQPRSFYYEMAQKDLVVEKYDPILNEVYIISKADLVIRPHPEAASIDYRHSYRRAKGETADQVSFTINGKPLDEWREYFRSKDIDGGELLPYVKLLSLPMAEKYEISQEFRLRLQLDKSPYIRTTYRTFVQRCTVSAASLCGEIDILFQDFGTLSSFTDVFRGSTALCGKIQKEYKPLLLPGQGYNLIFVRRHHANAAGDDWSI